MPRGGARNRSGPAPDPQSLRSAGRDFQAIALPREGHKGEPPEWPLEAVVDPELALWRQLWKTPQAAAWAQEPWRWRIVAQYARLTLRMEAPESSVSLVPAVVRLGDQIGLTPAGLRENGWTISKDQVAAQRSEPSTGTRKRSVARAVPDYRSRFEAVGEDAG